MKEKPILFNGAMVRAILEGRKTQTRRVAKCVAGLHLKTGEPLARCDSAGPRVACPYGKPGDRLWVRESGWERPERTAKMMREGADTWPRFAYAADGWSDQDRADFKAWGFKPRPSIHMPRWASRITLEITAVRVELLQDISEADAMAEGVNHNGECDHIRHYCEEIGCWGPNSYKGVYAETWESINGPGSWNDNPWVWVVEFKRVGGEV